MHTPVTICSSKLIAIFYLFRSDLFFVNWSHDKQSQILFAFHHCQAPPWDGLNFLQWIHFIFPFSGFLMSCISRLHLFRKSKLKTILKVNYGKALVQSMPKWELNKSTLDSNGILISYLVKIYSFCSHLRLSRTLIRWSYCYDDTAC